MATFSVSSVSEDYDFVKYYCCTICERDRHEFYGKPINLSRLRSVKVDADYYCKECKQFFCKKCFESHEKHIVFLKNKSIYGRDKIMKWPLPKEMEHSLIRCEIHKDEKIMMYCPDHSQLCCSRCADYRRCLQVAKIPPTIMKYSDFKNMSVKTQNIISQLKRFQTFQEDGINFLKFKYHENEKHMVDYMRRNITSFLLNYEHIAVNEFEHKLFRVSNMRDKINDLLEDFEKSKLKKMKEKLKLKLTLLISVTNDCIMLHDKLLHLDVVMQKVRKLPELSFIASIKCQQSIEQSETYLKESFLSNLVLTVDRKYEHNVKMRSDSNTCMITAISVLPDGQVLVADKLNNNVKLLNKNCQMVSHWDVTGCPRGICQVTPSNVAVTVDDYGNTHEVQLITVTQSQLVPDMKFQLEHRGRGIAHHQDDLFITSGTALYKYSLSGILVCRLYEDASGDCTVRQVAVSPTGDKLYVTNPCKNRLLTLARDGTVLASFTNSELDWPRDVHVTPAGQVLVCRWRSDNILQVHSGGMRKVATLSTEIDGVRGPLSLCYNSTFWNIMVGQFSDSILSFGVERGSDISTYTWFI